MAELRRQVTVSASLMDTHRDLYAELATAMLGFEVNLVGPAERWIVWPELPGKPGKRVEELRAEGIRVVEYRESEGDFSFRVGPACTMPRT